jgi:RHS repeat-associated protein
MAGQSYGQDGAWEMPDGNPLIAAPQETTTAVTGIGIAESCVDVAHGVSNGDWVEAGLGVLGAGLEVLSMVIDPLGTLASYGVSWLIEHVRPLKEALDWFAGDPPVIRSFSATWDNVANEVDTLTRDFQTETASGTAGWTGAAGDAYRAHATETADAIAGAGSLAGGISAGVMIMGEVVAFVREFVRDMVGELVGRLISWALEEVASLGLATPLVVAQATSAISKVVNKVSDLCRKLVKTIGNVAPRIRKIIDKLDEIIQKLAKLMRRANSPDTPTLPTSAARHADDAPNLPNGSTTPAGAHTDTPTTHTSATPDTPNTTSTPDTTTSPGGTTRTDGSTSTPTDGTTNRPGNPNDTSSPVNGRQCVNDPIDVASGEMVLHQTDLELAGALPLLLTRTHVSSYRAGRSFGRSWSSTVDQRLELDAQGIVFVADQGMILVYPRPLGDEAVLPVAGPRRPLRRVDGGYTVTDPETSQVLHFHGVDTGTGGDLPLVSVVDRNGHRVDVLRDSAGVPTQLRHSGGYLVRALSSGGLITELRLHNPDGGEIPLVRYRYDEARRLTEVINSSSLPLRFDYDSAGRITRWEDRNGEWYSYRYDELGRCVGNEGSHGFLGGSFDYGSADGHRVTVFTDSLGHRTTYHCNEIGRVVREVDPLGNTTRSEWDAHGRLLARTDPLGRTTRYTFDDAGNLVLASYPNGFAARAEYDEHGRPVMIVDPDGAMWRREYDARGNLVAITDPSGAVTTTAYAPGETAVTDALGKTRRVRTNAAGLPVAVTDPLGATTRYVRDAFGRVTQIIDPLGGVVRLGWTVEGRLISRVLPDGSTDRWRYDGEGNPVEHIDALGRRSRTEYTGFDLPAARVAPDGSRLEFGYDTQLRLTSVTNAAGLVWHYEWDAAGNLVRETDFDGRVLGYTHDAAGQLVARQNGAGEVVRFTRDALGNVSEKRAGDVLAVFDYDPVGRLVRAANPDADVRHDRDAAGRVISESCNGNAVVSSYDVLGRRIGRTTPSGALSTWEYDARDQPVSLTTAGHTIRFGYDAIGREVRRELGAAFLTQDWDPNHRLVGQSITGLDRPLQQRRYHYRPDGHVVGIEDRLAGGRRFELDLAGRVTAVHAATWSERYAYDGSGNLTGAEGPAEVGPGGRDYAGTLVRRAGNTHYEHDAQGRVRLRRHRTLSGQVRTWSYTWDAEDRLTEVSTPDGARWRYTYDPLGRRIAKQRTDSAERVDFVWDGLTLAEQATTGGVTTWDYEPGNVRPLAQTVDAAFYALVTDLVGTPTEMLDARGGLAWRAQTTLWGNAFARLSAGPDCPLRFPGQYHDAETGQNYNYFRYYDPESGRYQSNDPLGLGGGPDPSGYLFNPLTGSDPLGLTPCYLTQTGPNTYQSPGGLVYGPDPSPNFNSRVDHVMNHANDIPGRPQHGVFNSNNPNDVMRMVDDAYGRVQQGGVFSVQQGSRTVYFVNMGQPVGYIGGVPGGLSGNPAVNYVQLVLQNGNEVVTAFPVSGIPSSVLAP